MSEAVSTAATGPLPSAMWLWRSSPAEAVEVVRFVAERVLDAVLDPADRVTVMAYRDHAEEGRLVLDREGAVVANQLTGNPRYLGIAVHDGHHWRRLA